MTKRARWPATLLGLLVAAGLLALVGWGADWGEVWATLAGGRWEFVAPAAALVALQYSVKGLRWRVLLSERAPVPRALAIRLVFVGFLMNNLLPARLGELGRPMLLSARQPEIPLPFALATMVGDKVFDLLFTILCLLLASALMPLPDFARGGLAALSLLGLLVLGAAIAAARWEAGWSLLDRLLSRLGAPGVRLAQAARRFGEGLAVLSSPRVLLQAGLRTLLLFLLMGSALLLCMWAVGVPGTPAHVVFVLGLLGVGFAIPSPPTHAGTYHFFAAQALLLSGVAGESQALSFAVLAHAMQVTVVSLGGLIGGAGLGLNWRGELPPGSGQPVSREEEPPS